MAGDGRPRLTIAPECANTIAEFESYVWKETRLGVRDEGEGVAEHAARDGGPRGGGGVMGGLMGRFGRKKADPSKDAGAGATPGRTTIMTSTTETLSIATAVDAAALQVPAGLKLKNK